MDFLREKIESAWNVKSPAGLSQFLGLATLRSLSWAWGAGAWLRRKKYDWGVAKKYQIDCPVISIGNLTVGGTGKTPMVIEVARLFQNSERRVGIISRGYRRKGSDTLVVTDGKQILSSASEAGDEPLLMAQSLDGIILVVGADRVAAAQKARELGADIILMDDGFQHRRLARDLDIVLWDTTRDPETMRFLPRGPMREGLGALRRAQALIFTRCNLGGFPPRRILARIKQQAPHLAVFQVGLEIESLTRLNGEAAISSAEELKGRKIATFCGIGNPASFERLLEQSGADLVVKYRFPDHYRPTLNEMNLNEAAAMETNAQWIVTTEKDVQNLPADWKPKLPVWVVRTRLSWEEDRERFRSFILQASERGNTCK